jgi:hypothetical protein
MRSFIPKILLILLLLTGELVTAQVKFSATITPEQISKDEYAQLRLIVENAKEVEQILPPVLNNFIVISGPNQESGMTMINGDVKKYIAINFIIKPKGPGNFTIPSTGARADGREFRSNPVGLKVTNTISGNNSGSNGFVSPFNGMDPFSDATPENSYSDDILRKGENPLDKIKNNILVKLETNKTTCYVGEPVIATYKLYTRLKSESSLTKSPYFNGFSVIDLLQPDNVNYKIEKLNGREYNVYTIRKAQLYPLQPGNLELESAEIENNVHFIKEEYVKRQRDIMNDMFRDFADTGIPAEGVEDHKVTLQSKPLMILVKPLPEVDKPADFRGAVGNFAIEAAITKNNFTTDDAGRLTIIISGVGNMQMVTAPEINWPQGIEGFEPRVTDDLFKTTVPVSGRKIIEYPFTVSRVGNYSIPAVTFSFFDTKDVKYKTVTTKPVNFTVTAGTGKPKNNTVTETTKGKESFLNQFFSNRWRVVSMVAVIIICGLIFWLKKERKKDKVLIAAMLEEEKNATTDGSLSGILLKQQDPLSSATASLNANDSARFYPLLNQSLKQFLADKFGIPLEELNKKSISEKMDNKEIPVETSLQLNTLMDEIEWQLYTPSTANEQMQVLYEKANGLVQLLNTYKI